MIHRSVHSGRRSQLCGRKSGGFSIVSAIFLLVVIAGLAAAILNISAGQQRSSALDVQGVRAYQAARAGIEWGLYQQRVNGQCLPAASIAAPAATTLSTFTITVRCTETAGAAPNLTRWKITSSACNEPAGGSCPNAASGSSVYLQRVLEVQF